MNKINDIEDSIKESIYFIETINQILVAASCPEEYRSFIDFLIGYSQGRFEFEVSDLDLAWSEKPFVKDVTDSALTKWVQRKRSNLEEYQDKHKLYFVECEHGKWDRHNNIYSKSKYRLHILEYAKSVLIEAKEDESFWNSNSLYAIKIGANNLIQRLPHEQIIIPKGKTYKPEGAAAVKTILRTMKTEAQKIRPLLDDAETEMYLETRTLYEELKQIIEGLKDKVGNY